MYFSNCVLICIVGRCGEWKVLENDIDHEDWQESK